MMEMYSFALWFLCGFVGAFAALPSGWKACRRSDPAYNECLKGAIGNAIKTIGGGSKEFGIASLDPFHVPKVVLNKSKMFNVTLSEVTVTGFEQFNVKKVENDDWKVLRIWFHYPNNILFESNYNVIGKILTLNVKSVGTCNMTFTDLKVNVNITLKEQTRDGRAYLEPVRLDISTDPNHFSMYYQPSDQNQAFTDNLNKMLNRNWRPLLAEQKRNGETVFAEFFFPVVHDIISKIPKEDYDLK